jgi:hypothetical protein
MNETNVQWYERNAKWKGTFHRVGSVLQPFSGLKRCGRASQPACVLGVVCRLRGKGETNPEKR